VVRGKISERWLRRNSIHPRAGFHFLPKGGYETNIHRHSNWHRWSKEKPWNSYSLWGLSGRKGGELRGKNVLGGNQGLGTPPSQCSPSRQPTGPKEVSPLGRKIKYNWKVGWLGGWGGVTVIVEKTLVFSYEMRFSTRRRGNRRKTSGSGGRNLHVLVQQARRGIWSNPKDLRVLV